MSLPKHQVIVLKAAIANRLASDELNDWQRGFLTDMQSRLMQFGTETRLSQKQVGALGTLTGFEPRADPSSPHEEIMPATQRRNPPQKRDPSPHLKPKRKTSPPRRSSPLKIYRRAHRSVSEAKLAILLVIGIVFAISSIVSDISNPPSVSSTGGGQTSRPAGASFSVTDGDTIKLSNGTAVRLIGFNTPETYKPQCDREYQLGKQATTRLKGLVSTATSIDLQLVQCACKPGTHGTKACNFGRSCGVLAVDGVDVGRTLISEGLATKFLCGATNCPRLPRPWCG